MLTAITIRRERSVARISLASQLIFIETTSHRDNDSNPLRLFKFSRLLCSKERPPPYTSLVVYQRCLRPPSAAHAQQFSVAVAQLPTTITGIGLFCEQQFACALSLRYYGQPLSLAHRGSVLRTVPSATLEVTPVPLSSPVAPVGAID